MTRVATRLIGLLTVVAVSAVASLFAPPVVSEPAPSEPFPWTHRLSGDWSERVVDHLGSKRLRIELEDLEAVVELVERSAKRFDVDPLTILAVIHVESHFDTFAVSPVGAKGLMQLREPTARSMADELGVEWTTEDRLHEAELNVLLGTYYLRTLVDRFGDLDVALAAFNEGPTKVRLRQNRSVPLSYRYADRVRDALVDLQFRTIL